MTCIDLMNEWEYAVWLTCEELVDVHDILEDDTSEQSLEAEEAADLPAEVFDDVLAAARAA